MILGATNKVFEERGFLLDIDNNVYMMTISLPFSTFVDSNFLEIMEEKTGIKNLNYSCFGPVEHIANWRKVDYNLVKKMKKELKRG